jgi:hypothetical protein
VYTRKRRIQEKLWFEKLIGRYHLENVGIDGRIISEFVLRIWDANKPYSHFITGNFSVIH